MTQPLFLFVYFGNATSISAGENTLASYEYEEKDDKFLKTNYSNALTEEYVYNLLDLISEIRYNKDGKSCCDSRRTLSRKCYTCSAYGDFTRLDNNRL